MLELLALMNIYIQICLINLIIELFLHVDDNYLKHIFYYQVFTNMNNKQGAICGAGAGSTYHSEAPVHPHILIGIHVA